MVFTLGQNVGGHFLCCPSPLWKVEGAPIDAHATNSANNPAFRLRSLVDLFAAGHPSVLLGHFLRCCVTCLWQWFTLLSTVFYFPRRSPSAKFCRPSNSNLMLNQFSNQRAFARILIHKKYDIRGKSWSYLIHKHHIGCAWILEL